MDQTMLYSELTEEILKSGSDPSARTCAVMETQVEHTELIAKDPDKLWQFVKNHTVEAEALCQLLKKKNESSENWTLTDLAWLAGGEFAFCIAVSAGITHAAPNATFSMWATGTFAVLGLKGVNTVTSWICAPAKGKGKRKRPEPESTNKAETQTLRVENKRMKSQASQLQTQVTRKDAEITRKDAEITRKDAEITRLKQKAADLEEANGVLGEQLANSQQQ